MHRIFNKLISKSQQILITTHVHPDADGIGSQVALCLALRKLGKEAWCVNQEPLLDRYNYLDPLGMIKSHDEFMKDTKEWNGCDLFIITDTNDLERIGSEVKALVETSKEILYIDHHPCPNEIKALHCIDTTKAATGELVGELIQSLNISFDQQMALTLYTAILIDTSSFRYPSVTGDTHRLVAKLLDTGINPPLAYNLINGTKKISHLRLLGKVLSCAKVNQKGNIAWLSIEQKDLKDYDADPEDTHAYINHLLVLDGPSVSCMFRELSKNRVKVSFRSAGRIDVGIMAKAIGGGGHNHSSAAILDGKIKDVILEVIEKVELMLEAIENS